MKSAVTFPVILGQVVIRRRKARNLTQENLASALGVQPSSMSRLERGVAMFSVPQLRRVAARLGTTVVSLVGEAEKAAEDNERKGGKVLEEDPPEGDKVWTMVAPKVVEQTLIHLATLGFGEEWTAKRKAKEQVKVKLGQR